jgi:hypothetical protein
MSFSDLIGAEGGSWTRRMEYNGRAPKLSSTVRLHDLLFGMLRGKGKMARVAASLNANILNPRFAFSMISILNSSILTEGKGIDPSFALHTPPTRELYTMRFWLNRMEIVNKTVSLFSHDNQ